MLCFHVAYIVHENMGYRTINEHEHGKCVPSYPNTSTQHLILGRNTLFYYI